MEEPSALTAQWADLLDHLEEAILLLDQSGAPAYANRAWVELAGPLPEGGLVATLSRLPGRLPASLIKALREQQAWRGSLLDLERDGRQAGYEVAYRPDSRMLLLYNRSERRRLETELLQTHKMESLGHLASGVAHDFANLVTAMNGYCDLVLHQSGLPERLQRDLREINNIGGRAAELVSRLLAYSRRHDPHREDFDLNGLVHDLAGMLRRLIGEHLRLELQLDAEHAVLCADRAQLEMALVNLVINARDAMPDGGVIRVCTSCPEEGPGARHRVTHGGRWLLLEVHDEGTGMDEDTRERLFQPFFSTKSPGKGTGLGLAVVQRAVESNGGAIEVESQPGEGSSFHLWLPALPALADMIHSEVWATASEETGVLVVEDEDVLRELATTVLESRGYQVKCARNLQEALHCLDHGSFHTVLCDVALPDGHGVTLAEHVRRRLPHAGIIVCSAYPVEDLGQGKLERLRCRYLPKPYVPESLLAAVSSATCPAERDTCSNTHSQGALS